MDRSSTTTMTAVRVTDFGEPEDVIEISEVPVPAIVHPSDLLVRVHFAAINPADHKVMRGVMGPLVKPKLPYTPGSDFSGEVVAVGPKVTKFKPGDPVVGIMDPGFAHGSFAEYCLPREEDVELVPDSLSMRDAAALPLVSLTSFQALTRGLDKENQRLLILGGSSATGIAAIQMAKNHFNCSSITVTSSQEELCLSLGADRVVNYKNEDWTEVLSGAKFDVIYDCIGGREAWDKARANGVLSRRGCFVTIVGELFGDETITFFRLIGSAFSLLNRKFWGTVGSHRYKLHGKASNQELSEILELATEGKLKPLVDPSPLRGFDDVLEMFEKCISHSARGKLVLTVHGDHDVAARHGEQKSDGDASADAPS